MELTTCDWKEHTEKLLGMAVSPLEEASWSKNRWNKLPCKQGNLFSLFTCRVNVVLSDVCRFGARGEVLGEFEKTVRLSPASSFLPFILHRISLASIQNQRKYSQNVTYWEWKQLNQLHYRRCPWNAGAQGGTHTPHCYSDVDKWGIHRTPYNRPQRNWHEHFYWGAETHWGLSMDPSRICANVVF